MSPLRIPMFPLGRPCLPGEIVPLRIFEARYLTMLRQLKADNSNLFGTVLIERGFEVGGGDTRCSIGSILEIETVRGVGDDSVLVLCRTLDRIRVLEWLDDEPHPWAMVEDFPISRIPRENEGSSADELAVRENSLNAIVGRCAEILGSIEQFSPHGRTSPEGSSNFFEEDSLHLLLDQLPADHKIFALAGLLPVGSADRQSLLEAVTYEEQCLVLSEILVHLEEMLRFQSSF